MSKKHWKIILGSWNSVHWEELPFLMSPSSKPFLPHPRLKFLRLKVEKTRGALGKTETLHQENRNLRSTREFILTEKEIWDSTHGNIHIMPRTGDIYRSKLCYHWQIFKIFQANIWILRKYIMLLRNVSLSPLPCTLFFLSLSLWPRTAESHGHTNNSKSHQLSNT